MKHRVQTDRQTDRQKDIPKDDKNNQSVANGSSRTDQSIQNQTDNHQHSRRSTNHPRIQRRRTVSISGPIPILAYRFQTSSRVFDVALKLVFRHCDDRKYIYESGVRSERWSAVVFRLNNRLKSYELYRSLYHG